MATPQTAASKPPKPFELIAGDPALDFVNTLDDRYASTGPLELIATYDDLLRFAAQSELLSEKQARKLKRFEATEAERNQALQSALELREAIAQFAYAKLDNSEPSDATLAALEKHLQQAAAQRHLAVENLQLTWSWRGLSRHLAAPVWLLAQAAADLLLSDRSLQIRACSSDTCRWLFLDTSKNHTRRWCDMKICGNRMKARRFQARQSAQ